MWNLPVVANHRKTRAVGTMRAIRVDHYGEPVKVLAIGERPVPEAVDGEVRFRILASAVNPSDLRYQGK
jgi:D-arabinose 1-dehydrogenase-like Zn-dependent alcohol dehydrogenase